MIDQSVNQPNDLSVGQSISHFDLSVSQAISQMIDHAVNQSVSQINDQSIRQMIDQSVSQGDD